MTTSRKIKIDVISVPFSGHLYPLIELLTPFIGNEKYDIRFITGVQKIPIIEQSGFVGYPLFADQPTIMEDIANTETQVKLLEMYQQLKQNIGIVPEAIKQIEETVRQRETDLVIADFISVPAGIVSTRLTIPWITTIPTPFALETRDGTPSYLGGWSNKTGFWFRWRDYLGRKLVRFCKKMFFFLIRKSAKKLDITLYNEQGEENIYSPFSILGIGMKELEFPRTFPTQYKWLGPCCFSPEREQIVIPDKDQFQKVVFVTIGTHLLWGKASLAEKIVEVAASFPEVLFIISLGDVQKGTDYQLLKRNVYQYGYIPYSKNLAQFDYVIHHGGAGILYNCIYYQKPALILPHDYDQFDYAARAQACGIGIVAKKRTTNHLVLKLKQLFQKKEWQQLKELNQQFNKYEPSKILEAEIKRLMNEVDK